jgi:Mg2+/Co2+ transporter CorB
LNIGDGASVLSARDELRGAIAMHHKEETLVKSDRDMLGGILDLKDLEVADIMVHRIKMRTLESGIPAKQLVSDMLNSPYTRMPVWKDNPDNIVGVMHAKTLFAALQQADGDTSKIVIDDIMTPAWFVPDTRPLEDQLNAFLRKKVQLALVVDEYGEVQGLVTLEDILEEIVGDIKDEFDGVATGVRKTRDGSFVVDGSVAIRDLNRSFDWKLPDNEATTIAGLVIHQARMIPMAGQVFSFFGFKFEVLKKRKQQLTSLKITPVTVADEEAASG